MTSIFLKNTFDEKLRDSIMNKLGKIVIQTRPMWHLCHLQKPHIKKQSYKIENALDIQMKTINVPSSTGISEEQLSEVVLKLKHLL